MKRDYVAEKAAKKQSTKQVMWMLLIVVILLGIIMVRLALRLGSKGEFYSSMPSGNDALSIAKDYIRPTLKSPDVDFADEDFQYTKTNDSVYTINSYFLTSFNNQQKVKTNFMVKMKYNGGTVSSDKNWSLLNLNEH